MRHKWTKGPLPNECVNCGMIRRRVTWKLLMAITSDGKSHYKYGTKFIYQTEYKSYGKAPKCKGKRN